MEALDALILSKAYTKATANDFGAVKGANCQITRIDTTGESTKVTFTWKNQADETKTTTISIPNGKAGVSITNVYINEDLHIIVDLSDGNIIDAGEIIIDKPELSEDLTASVDIGSVTNGKTYNKGTSLETIIRDMLIKVESPVVSLSISPSATVYDVVSDSITEITFTATVTKKTYELSKIDFYAAGNLVNSQSVTDSGTYSFIYQPSTAITSDITFKVTVTDSKNKTGNSSKSVVFVGKSYYGIVSDSITSPDETIIKALSGNTLKTSKTFEYQNITMDFGKVLYAYPKSFGNLSTIKDEINNINYTDSFTKFEITVDSIIYNCYLLTEPTGADGVTIKFS